jgi:hypothetical protein
VNVWLPVALKSVDVEFVTVKVTVSVVYCGTAPASKLQLPLAPLSVPEEDLMPGVPPPLDNVAVGQPTSARAIMTIHVIAFAYHIHLIPTSS